MPWLNHVVLSIIIGVGLYLIYRFFPVASGKKSIPDVIAVVVVCSWLLQLAGVWENMSDFRLTP